MTYSRYVRALNRACIHSTGQDMYDLLPDDDDPYGDISLVQAYDLYSEGREDLSPEELASILARKNGFTCMH